MKKIEHIGIAVKSLENAGKLFEKLLGKKAYKVETVASEKVITSFFEIGGVKLELLASDSPDSAIGKFIEKRGEGIHHIAFAVENLESEMKRLKSEGFQLINEIPVDGADNKLTCFFHPKTTGGVLIELCHDKDPTV